MPAPAPVPVVEEGPGAGGLPACYDRAAWASAPQQQQDQEDPPAASSSRGGSYSGNVAPGAAAAAAAAAAMYSTPAVEAPPVPEQVVLMLHCKDWGDGEVEYREGLLLGGGGFGTVCWMQRQGRHPKAPQFVAFKRVDVSRVTNAFHHELRVLMGMPTNDDRFVRLFGFVRNADGGKIGGGLVLEFCCHGTCSSYCSRLVAKRFEGQPAPPLLTTLPWEPAHALTSRPHFIPEDEVELVRHRRALLAAGAQRRREVLQVLLREQMLRLLDALYQLHEGEVLAMAAKRGDPLKLRPAYHGDVKTPNILVDGEGRFKLADFGLARVDMGASVLSYSQVKGGTPG